MRSGRCRFVSSAGLSWRGNLLATCFAVMTMIGGLAAQVGVRLTHVPDRVMLPALPGQNLIVEVEVKGGPDSVWLAVKAADANRVPLDSVGGDRFQVNLRDDRVPKILGASRDDGDLRVFARVDGKTQQSAKISWVRGQPTEGMTCTVIDVEGKSRQCRVGQKMWIDPAKVARVEVRGMTMPQAKAIATAGQTTLPLARAKPHQPLVLKMNDGIRDSLYEASDFGIFLGHGAKTWWFEFQVVPRELQPGAHLVVMQRQTAALPDSNGWMRVRVGDVTAGQVLVSMADAEGKIFKRSRSMMDKDAIMFALGEEEYALVLKRIVNRLVGSDHVTFEIVDKEHYRPDVIAALMRRVAADSGIYVRDGVDYSMTHFHDLLRAQVAGYRGKRPSPEKFLEDVVKSGRFGEESHIKRGDGTTVTPKEWLTAELARVRRDLR